LKTSDFLSAMDAEVHHILDLNVVILEALMMVSAPQKRLPRQGRG